MNQDTKRELDLLWNQGVKVLREDVKEVKDDVKSLANGISSMRRWAVGLIVSSGVAIAVAVIGRK